jgi:hypothetical protein
MFAWRLFSISAVQVGLIDLGNNLQYPDSSCGASLRTADPMLDSLYVPLLGGPALGGGRLTLCIPDPVSARDVFGHHRPQGKSCSIGAVEGSLEDLLHRRRARSDAHR